MTQIIMSKEPGTLREVKVEVINKRRHTHGPLELMEKRNYPKMSSKSNDFEYVNAAYVGSTNSLNQRQIVVEPPTRVIREQYWACSKWPFGQRVMAACVGLLVGAVIGLAVTLALRGSGTIDLGSIGEFFRSPAPD